VVERIVAGDSVAALPALHHNAQALLMAQTGFAHAFSILMLAAAAIAAVSGVLLFHLMGSGNSKAASVDAVAV
jgi:hypothetical protein